MGRSRPGKPPLSGESDPVAESCGAGKGGQALGRRRRRKGLRPSSRGGRARRAAAEYPPGYDGLPGGAQGLRAFDYDYDYEALPGFAGEKAMIFGKQMTMLDR